MIQKEIINTLLNGQTSKQKSVTSKIPLPYHWIPGEIRFLLSLLIFSANIKNLRRTSNLPPEPYSNNSSPAPYADNSVDLSQSGLWEQVPPMSHWAWPQNKKCALVFSHDVDTKGQKKGITLMHELGIKHGLKNTFSFVGKHLPDYRDLLKHLRDQDVEIALHDMVHDNEIAFLSKQEIVRRLQPIKDLMEEFDIVGFRSPSWYTSQSLWESLSHLNFSYDMSALDTWPFFDQSRNYGVRTFYPFMVNDLVVLPNTIPFELPWYCGFSKKNTLAFWKPKLDYIAASGGLIMINAHPDRWFCGNKRAAAELDRCLEYIISKHDPARMTASGVSKHFRTMDASNGVRALEEGPLSVRVPNLHVRASLQCASPY